MVVGRILAVCAALFALGISPGLAEAAGGLPSSDAIHLVQAPEPTQPAQPAPFAPTDTLPDPTGGFRYPAAFLVPLALLVLGGMLARTLTRPIPRRR